MIITTEIQNKLKSLFGQFVEMTKLSKKSKGYYEMSIVGENVTYKLYDKNVDDNSKIVVFEKSFDLSSYANYADMKKAISPMLEKSIREFCKS
jgi:hypothetical protein